MPDRNREGPRALATILADLFTVRGYSRVGVRSLLETAWNEAVGKPSSDQTCLGDIRRGVLDVTVAHSALLQELSAFRKEELLRALQRHPAGFRIRDFRFRLGVVDHAHHRPDGKSS